MIAKDKVSYRVCQVSFGWCAAAQSREGICALVLPVADENAAEAAIRKGRENARRSRSALGALAKAVERYFDGWRTEFDDFRIDVSSGTAFQQRVWALTRRIPYGQVRSYRWIGMEMGRPRDLRAIGSAVAGNPIPLIVPCHRVVHADGRLGGFSAQGGVDLKARMLEIERVRLFGEGPDRKVMAEADRETGN